VTLNDFPFDDAEELLETVATGVVLGGPDSPVSPRTLERWRSEEKGPPFIRVGRLVRYRRSDLRAWLAKRTRNLDAHSFEEQPESSTKRQEAAQPRREAHLSLIPDAGK
jgi:hypothetical protein